MGQFESAALFFAAFAAISLRPSRSKAFEREVHQEFAKGAKNIAEETDPLPSIDDC